jgi:hypothetical protein
MEVAPLDIEDAVAVVERKILSLETIADARLGPSHALPPVDAPRTWPSSRAMHNAVDSTILRLEKTAAALPRAALEGRSHIQAALIDYDPGELYYKRVGPSVSLLIDAAIKISDLVSEFGNVAGIVCQQAELLGECVRHQTVLISKASRIAKPQDPQVLKAECEPLVDASAEIAELKYDVEVRNSLRTHVMALSDTAAALGWVVVPTPLKHVRDYKGIVTGQTESILASYIDLGCNPIHSDFAEALNAVMDALVDYVEKEHPAGLRWNYAQGATPAGYRRAERHVSPDAHPIGDVYKLIHGAVARYYTSSRELGGSVAKQAEAIVAAYIELARIVETASNSLRPPGIGEGELRLLLMPLLHELRALDPIHASISEGYKYRDHVDVVQEFVAVMQWCTASLNKMSPVSFIIDVQGVTDMYLDRLVARHSGPVTANDSYVIQLHREWSEAVRDMLHELLQYVKDHHPNGLTYDTQRSRKSMDEINRKLSLSSKLDALKTSGTARRWRQVTASKEVRGRQVVVRRWH